MVLEVLCWVARGRPRIALHTDVSLKVTRPSGNVRIYGGSLDREYAMALGMAKEPF